MKHIIIITITSLFFSCSVERKIDSAVNKIGAKSVIDYIATKYRIPHKDSIVVDTFIIKTSVIDTQVITKKIDTIVINRNNEKINIIRHYDTIFVFNKDVKADTIIKLIKVPTIVTEEYNKKARLFDILNFLFDVFICAITAIVVYIIIKKVQKILL